MVEVVHHFEEVVHHLEEVVLVVEILPDLVLDYWVYPSLAYYFGFDHFNHCSLHYHFGV